MNVSDDLSLDFLYVLRFRFFATQLTFKENSKLTFKVFEYVFPCSFIYVFSFPRSTLQIQTVSLQGHVGHIPRSCSS